MKKTAILLSLLVGIFLSSAANATDNTFIGKLLFDLPPPGGNERACATCHVESDHFILKPEHVSTAPNYDPLFRAIDSDDPSAHTKTYAHLHSGLVRVELPLAKNLDVIDMNGNIITNATRTITVWRGVPTIENVVLTAPYQQDGRAPTLQAQAADALKLHAQLPYLFPQGALDLLANFESSIFSSSKIQTVAKQIAKGKTPADPDLLGKFAPNSDEAEGQKLFAQACALCHGGARGNQITSQDAHDQTLFALNPNGTPVFGPQGPVLAGHHQDDPFMNIGTAGLSYLTQPGTGPIPELPAPFNSFTYIDQFPNKNTLELPHYRIRFYTDNSRTNTLVDLPPLPTLGLSPSFVPQAYSVDPGRSIVTGDPYDYEAFKVPQLRRLKNTAPYFHDNSMKTLDDVVEFYSSRVFVFVTAAGLPPINPSLSVGGAPESLSPVQKRQLVAFLNTL